MHYTLRDGTRRHKKHGLMLLAGLLLMVGGLYMLYNALSPILPNFGVDPLATVTKLKSSSPDVQENRLYMPQINVDIPVVEVQQGEPESKALDRGAIHRQPQNGNPKDGGNFVLAAHRFTLGLTPSETRAKSPFYHINEMKVGDDIYVDYDGVRYKYKIYEMREVAPSDIGIEARSQDPQLTIYSCTLAGSNDGRIVLFAKPATE